MPFREQQAFMGTTNLQAYARRKKVKKEEPVDRQDESVDFRGLTCGHSTADVCPTEDRLLSSEMDVAETLLELSGMSRLHSQQHKVLRWSSKRKRSASSFSRDSVVPSPQPDADLEDALSAIKRDRSGCAFGRDSCISDREEFESTRCSKDSVSVLGSRAQSPSSPLPSLQLTSRIFRTGADTDVKSAFQALRPAATCLLSVKAEVEDLQPELPLKRHIQVSLQPMLKPCKSFMGFNASLKTESGLSHNVGGLNELGAKSTATEVKDPRAGSLRKVKCTLSEEEREARRLRRIQANRESARQTIRKKQVLCEELRKKAFSLHSENEAMRQKRDTLMQELYCLKGQNYHLKQQLEKKSSANLEYDTVTIQEKNASDATSRPSSQPAGLPYASVPPALFWAMAAATTAAAANQAYALHKQEFWAASSNLQNQNIALALSGSEPPFKQLTMPASVQENLNVSCGGESSLTATDSPQKEMVDQCASSPESEGQCNGSSHDTAHSAAKCANKGSSGNIACDMSSQTGVRLPRPMALNTLRSTPATSKSMEFMQHRHVVQGPATGFNHSHSVAGYSKENPQAQSTKDYATMAAAEARRRRKELTRNKFARARALKPTAVS